MLSRIRASLVVLYVCLLAALIRPAFHLLNAPSDVAFTGGVLILCFLLILAPLGFTLIFWRKKSNDSQPQ